MATEQQPLQNNKPKPTDVVEAHEECNLRTPAGLIMVEEEQDKPIRISKQPEEPAWYFCNCGKAFAKLELLEEHQTTHSPNFVRDWSTEEEDQNQCRYCEKKFSSEIHLRNHLALHAAEMTLQCEECEAEFNSSATLKAHKKVSHVNGGPYKCQFCPCQFASGEYFKRHLSFYHAGEAKSENVNLRKLEIKAEFQENGNGMESVEDDDQEDEDAFSGTADEETAENGGYPCTLCDKVFTKPVYLRNHIFVHSGVRSYVCDRCGAAFKSSSNLASHKKVSHVPDGKFKCEKCPCVFATLPGVVQHKHLFHSAASVNQFAAKKLAQAKAGQKVFNAAKQAPAAEAYYGRQEAETSQEEEVDTYYCEDCEISIAGAAEIQNHKQIHSGEKPHVCDLCGFGFRLSSAKEAHLQTSHVTGGRFPCDRCNCVFAMPVALQRHLSHHHTISQPTDFLEVSMGSGGIGGSQQDYEDEDNCFVPDDLDDDETDILQPQVNLSYTSPTRYQCLKCSTYFTHSKSLKLHSQVAHVAGGEKCPHCPCAFNTVKARSTHITKYHNSGRSSLGHRASPSSITITPVQVTQPQRMYHDRGDITIQGIKMGRTMAESHHQCKCGKEFNSGIAFANHRRACTGEPFKCKYCEETFRTKEDCQVHTKALHQARAAAAAVQEMVQQKPPLSKPPPLIQIQHKGSINGNGETTYKCSQCNYPMHSLRGLRKHMLTGHVKGGQFPCKFCPCVFATYNGLNSHIGYRHSGRTSEASFSVNHAKQREAVSVTKEPTYTLHQPEGKPSTSNGSTTSSNFMQAIRHPSAPAKAVAKRPSELMRRMAMLVDGASSSIRRTQPAHLTSAQATAAVEVKNEPEDEDEGEEPIHNMMEVQYGEPEEEEEQELEFNPQEFCVPQMDLEATLLQANANGEFGDDEFRNKNEVPVCQVCGKTYSSFHALRIHSTVHTGEKPFPCDLCGMMFRQKGDIVSHKRTNHVKDGKFRCKLCPCQFLTIVGLNRHSVAAHSGAQEDEEGNHLRYSQMNGNESGEDAEDYANDEQQNHVESPDTGEYEEEEEQKEEEEEEEEQVFECSVCGAAFSTDDDLSSHKQKEHNQFSCKVCNKSFASGTSLRTHMAFYHGESMKQTSRASSASASTASSRSSMSLSRPSVRANVSNRPMNPSAKIQPTNSSPVVRSAAKPTPKSTPVSAATTPASAKPSPKVAAQELPPEASQEEIYPIPRLVGGKKAYTCSSCRYNFQSKSHCFAHIKVSHVSGGDFDCHMCPCIFGTQRGLVTHISIHHSEAKGAVEVAKSRTAAAAKAVAKPASKAVSKPPPVQPIITKYKNTDEAAEDFFEQWRSSNPAFSFSIGKPTSSAASSEHNEDDDDEDVKEKSPQIRVKREGIFEADDDGYDEPPAKVARRSIPSLTIAKVPQASARRIFGNGSPKQIVQRFAVVRK